MSLQNDHFFLLLFLQSYTQYIPLPITDLDSWLKTPSIYVFDCSAAGIIVKAFLEVVSTALLLISVFLLFLSLISLIFIVTIGYSAPRLEF